MNYYYYLMTTDNGGAPCCTPDLWSLAICKPSIRRKAQVGDAVIGFAGKMIDRNGGLGVVQVAKVTKKLEHGAYYAPASSYRDRLDCIYEKKQGNRYTWKKNVLHGRGDMDVDLGKDGDNATVLLSDQFRYFGRDRYEINWSEYQALRACLVALRRGHRVNHSPRVLSELQALSHAMLKTQRKLGLPTHPMPSKCDDDDSHCTCS